MVPALSVGEAVGDCIKAALEAQAFTYGTPPQAFNVVKRKAALLPQSKGPHELIVVVGEEARSEPFDGRRRLETFDAAVVIATPGGHKTGDDPAVRAIRDRAKQLIDDRDRFTFATLIAGAKINRATAVGGRPPFDPAALPKDLNWSWVGFEVETIVTRATS